MAKLSTKNIQKLARSIVVSSASGIQYAALVKEISQQHPEMSKGAIQGAVWNLHTLFPGEISKPARGLFISASAANNAAATIDDAEQETSSKGVNLKESDFHAPFSEYLKNELVDKI